jgi:hypothetical protein
MKDDSQMNGNAGQKSKIIKNSKSFLLLPMILTKKNKRSSNMREKEHQHLLVK